MNQKSFRKDLLRSIFKSKARFLSIMAIIAMGVGFFAGIKATEPDMILSADKYYKDYNLADFRIISPLGFKESDIQDVETLSGIDRVQTGFSKDVFLTSESGNVDTVRVFSFDPRNSVSQILNRPVLIDGRLPENPGEIVIEQSELVTDDILLGSQVTISLPDSELLEDSLKTSVYTVVGHINSPMYISFERGQSSIGDGSISFIAYISESEFSIEKVTDLFIRTSESQNLTAYSLAYKDYTKPIQAVLETLGEESMAVDTQELRAELDANKAELQANKVKADAELADGAQKLLDAAQEIIDGEQNLIDQEVKYTRQLADQRANLEQGKIDLAQGNQLYADNLAKWQQGVADYNTGLAQSDAAKVSLDESLAQLTQLQSAIDGLTAIRATLPADSLVMTADELAQFIASIRAIAPDLADSLQSNAHSDDPDLLAVLTGTIDPYVAQMVISKASGQSAYDAGLAQYQAGAEQLAASKTALDQGKIELDQARIQLDQSAIDLAAGEKALVQGKKELAKKLADGRQKLDDAKVELADGQTEYDTEKADALKEIADAEIKIQDAEAAILEIPDQWFVLNRDANPGYAGYGEDAKRIGAVAQVFPIFFFLVAALVCLTTMTRMVEEERAQIGTLKALGYGTLTISSKYLVYSLLASLSGALTGLLIGFRLFPGVIMDAYALMYRIPVRLTPDNLEFALISISLAVVTTTAAALLATLQELRAVPAVLMQVKAPKPGKRILLERIKLIWKRMSFIQKVTARNIFRYKTRFLMTVIGIAGCTSLLLTGFGLRDSINAIMDKQFSEIFVYDGLVAFDSDKNENEAAVADLLDNRPEVTDYIKTLSETVSALPAGSSQTYEASLMVSQDISALSDFYDLHERTTGAKIALPDDGAVVTEKLASLLQITVGDNISWRDSENRTYKIRVAAIAENYLTHYIYLSPVAFEQLTFRKPQFNTMVFNLDNAAALDEQVFKEELLGNDEIQAVLLTQNLAADFNDMIKSLNYVVLVLILSAGSLAFVVLYNLTNINITERIREIATIKVLGFRDKEVSAYVYRENMILTFIGTGLGLFLGFFMHSFVMSTMEIDTMMFGKDINWLSYIFAIALTVSFSVLVNIFMYYHLRKINMVESLKSIE